MATPWYTSTDLINAIKRKISFPISQNTFSDTDLLAFANEEMFISQVPAVLQFHEEYFVTPITIPLADNTSRYSIPNRAIGMRLRDLKWSDEQGNLFDMTRINADDKAFWQFNTGSNQSIHKFYVEGNDVVLTPQVLTSPTGYLNFFIFLRPNQLVLNNRAAIVQSFAKTITIDNTSMVAGDTVIIDGITFTAVTSGAVTNEFNIGGSSIITATNLVTSVNTNGVVLASNGTPSTNVVTLSYEDFNTVTSTSNPAGFVIPTTEMVQFDQIPSNITNLSKVDFLQTLPGHKTKSFDIKIPANGISGNTISFTSGSVPSNFIVGDYICSENECIIPQIPPDLHNGLAERTCARILAAIGDQEGLNNVNLKIQDIALREGSLVDNRVEGTPQKITARHSLLRYGKQSFIRRG